MACLFKLKVKTMLIRFFDVRGIVHMEFLPRGRTVNRDFYKDVLRRICDAVKKKGLNCGPKVLNDNGSSHFALSIQEFMAR